MQVHDSIALVTGANRGIGKAFVEGLLAAGAKKVYAGARNPADVTIRGATPIEVDITKVDQVRLAAEQCADVTVLINNAGIGAPTPFLASPDLRDFKSTMDTNYFGTLNMCRAFAPVLKRTAMAPWVASWSTAGLAAITKLLGHQRRGKCANFCREQMQQAACTEVGSTQSARPRARAATAGSSTRAPWRPRR